ncbi:DsrE/DsrF/TusD sulfur relay family protein [Ancylobacter dichloromethanicus]
MKTLIILNDPPYGTERCYNGLRLAHALAKADAANTVTVFLMADAVVAAKAGQKTPDGHYNMERMLKRIASGKGRGAAVRHLYGRARLERSRDDGGRAPQHDG